MAGSGRNALVVGVVLVVLGGLFGLAALQDAGHRGAAPRAGDAGAGRGHGLATAAARGSGGDRAGEAGGVGAGVGAAAAAHGAGQWQAGPAMDRRFFDQAFLSGPGAHAPALSGLLAGATWGASAAELRTRAPALARWAARGDPRFPRSHMTLVGQDRDGGLARLSVMFPDDGSARRVLASSWGEPVTAIDTRGTRRWLWLAPAAGLRVALVEVMSGLAEIDYQPYVPVARMIDPSTGQLRDAAVLGQTGTSLRATYGARFRMAAAGRAQLTGPVFDYAPAPAPLVVTLEGGRAVSLEVPIDSSWNPSASAALLGQLRRQLGPVQKQSGPGNHDRWTFASGVVVEQYAGSPVMTVQFQRR